MKLGLPCAGVLAACALAQAAAPVRAEGIGENAPASYLDVRRTPKAAEVVDRLGAKVPLDVRLTDHDGKPRLLGDYLRGDGDGQGTPVLLVLGYYECPMLCSLVLNAALEATKAIDLDAGRDFEVVVVSIDPAETAALAAQKRANYLKSYARPGAEAGWHFHVGDEAEVKRLAEAVGFGYFFDEKSGQWAHGAGVFFLSPDGTLARTLTGIELAPADVKYALIDASNGRVGTLVDRIVMSCFHYEADAHKYGFYIWGAVRLAGICIVVALSSLLVTLWRRERLRKGPAAV